LRSEVASVSMARALCILLLLGLTFAEPDKQACEAGQCEEGVEEVGLIQRGQLHRDDGAGFQGCITEADMDATIEAFMGAVVAIGKESGDCAAAKSTAQGALDAAYAYSVKGLTVQFKPTLTVFPYNYRPTEAMALSYFVGTCVCPGVTVPLPVAPNGCGLEDGYYANDTGFAFGDPPSFKGWSKVEFGGTARGGNPDTKSGFWYQTGGGFCHAAVAQGPICFTSAEDGSVTCVDKTFGFVPNPGCTFKKGSLRALLSTHHSSLQDHGC